MLKRGGGVCGSLWPWSEGGGRISCVDKEEEGAPGYVREGGGIQVKCGGAVPALVAQYRHWWRSTGTGGAVTGTGGAVCKGATPSVEQ
jgi:hypothetical protein